MTLIQKLVRRLERTGPISTAEFMTVCLHDPSDGYYASRPALGGDGDFITAPLISQMFGELIGSWAVETWAALGCPKPVRLVELGPGDGTLMSDMLRVARLDPVFLDAVELWLVERSPPLQRRQARQLAGWAIHWAKDLAEVPSGAPAIIIANEFLDCLPARQFIRIDGTWRERVVAAVDGRLVFGVTSCLQPMIPAALRSAPDGVVIERSDLQLNLGREVGKRMVCDRGAALFIDYGRVAPGFGDTLQALVRHKKVDPLQTAGEADLTVHADLHGFAAMAAAAGAKVPPIISQGDFLRGLGLHERAAALIRARPARSSEIERQVERLSDAAGMGELFQVVCVCSPDVRPPGFSWSASA